jgi:hypothetical protein
LQKKWLNNVPSRIVPGGQGRGTTCRLHPECTHALSAFCIEAQLSTGAQQLN